MWGARNRGGRIECLGCEGSLRGAPSRVYVCSVVPWRWSRILVVCAHRDHPPPWILCVPQKIWLACAGKGGRAASLIKALACNSLHRGHAPRPLLHFDGTCTGCVCGEDQGATSGLRCCDSGLWWPTACRSGTDTPNWTNRPPWIARQCQWEAEPQPTWHTRSRVCYPPDRASGACCVDVKRERRRTRRARERRQSKASTITNHNANKQLHAQALHWHSTGAIPSQAKPSTRPSTRLYHLPPSTDAHAHIQVSRVDDVIHELGLTAAQHTKIGTIFIKGISGGQKRRVAIGCELITHPTLLFLDEPTSGTYRLLLLLLCTNTTCSTTILPTWRARACACARARPCACACACAYNTSSCRPRACAVQGAPTPPARSRKNRATNPYVPALRPSPSPHPHVASATSLDAASAYNAMST